MMNSITPQTELKFFVAAPLNVEDLLEKEIKEAGGTPIRIHRTGIDFTGNLESAYRLCLWSRIGSRVFLELKKFIPANVEALYKEIAAYPWEEVMDSSLTMAVEVSQKNSNLGESRFLSLKIKDGVVDRLRDKTGVRPSIDTDSPDYGIRVHIQGEDATLSLDISGESLHRRGYRQGTGVAPLKENTAAALLMRGGWAQLAATGAPLLDPFCGSGTLLIEGALMASDTAPGLFRKSFGFVNWKGHDPELWEKLLAEARKRQAKGMKNLPPIRGYDKDTKVIKAAWDNVAAAGLSEYIHVEKQDVSQLKATEALQKPGLLVTNPPYGQRLEDEDALFPLYRLFGSVLKDGFPGWKGVMITSSKDLAKTTAIKADKLNTLYNGSLACTVMVFSLYSKEERKSLSERELPPLSPGAQMFANRLTKNLKHMSKWARRRGITSYRLYDADLPEYAVAVDFYENTWIHLQEYAPPATVPEAKAEQRRKDIRKALPRVLNVEGRNIFFKTRERKKGKTQYDKVATTGEKLIIQEGGHRFLTNFSDYLDTGIFLDHRVTRSIIQEKAQGKRFLNLFAYTGTCTVYAAAGGAKTTTTVDASATYLNWAQENMGINDFKGRNHKFIQADCIEWLVREREQYDLIFLDPPTFSNSKSRRTTFDVQRDQEGLLMDTLKLLAPGGTLIFSNNYRKFKLEESILSDYKVEEITGRTIPEDFQQKGKIHRCWIIEKE